MTIIDERKQYEVPFKNIQPGSTFAWDNYYFLKLAEGDFDVGNVNAVCLTDGVAEQFEETDLVTPIKAKMTIF